MEYKDFYKNLCKNIAEAMKSREMDRKYMASIVGISRDLFSNKINGNGNFNMKELYMIAEELLVPVAELVMIEDEDKK